MKSCLLCPRGKKCRGYILHTFILKLYDAMAAGENAEAIARQLTREDMVLLAEYGEKARETCWSKGFVMAVARKLADIAAVAKTDVQMRAQIERMVVMMDMLFAKLPKGLTIDLADMAMDVFNQACQLLEEQGGQARAIPANVVGQVCLNVSRGKRKAG